MSDELHDFLDCFHFIYPNLNDTFHYATADSEKIYLDGSIDEEEPEITNQSMLVDVWRKFGPIGIVAYCAKIRGFDPAITSVKTDSYWRAKKFLENWEYEQE